MLYNVIVLRPFIMFFVICDHVTICVIFKELNILEHDKLAILKVFKMIALGFIILLFKYLDFYYS